VDLYFTLAHTGARREEIRLLKRENIDFETGYMTLKNIKNGHDRSIRMGLSISTFLKSLPRISHWVFMSQFGWLLSHNQIDENIEILQRKHPKMKGWRCHDLRHSFAYNFLKRGGDMYALKAILEHRKILYGHFKAQDVERVSPYDI
jgi:integrase/recombinase XerD